LTNLREFELKKFTRKVGKRDFEGGDKEETEETSLHALETGCVETG